MDIREREALVQAALDDVKKTKFHENYQACDTEAMGVLLAEFFDWDGFAILETASAGLEDSNFHTTGAKLDRLIDTERKRIDHEAMRAQRADQRARGIRS